MNNSDRRCIGCEILPHKITTPGKLYVWTPTYHTQIKFVQVIRQCDLTYHLVENKTVIEVLIDQNLNTLTGEIQKNFSSEEMTNSRVVFLDVNESITIGSLGKTQSLLEFIHLSKSDWLLDILNENRMVTFFQPIVHAQDPTNIFAYECLLRGKTKNDELISPFQMYSIARNANLLFQLDRAARMTAIETSVHQNISNKLFINFNPSSIYDPSNCLKTTMDLMNQLNLSTSSVIFEVVETDKINDYHHLSNILKFYRDHGFSIALDDVGSGYSSLNLLPELSPDYVKIDMELVRNIHQDNTKAVIVAKLLEICHDLNIQCIAEGVETHDEYTWLNDHGADFLQGYLFAKPNATPPSNLNFTGK